MRIEYEIGLALSREMATIFHGAWQYTGLAILTLGVLRGRKHDQHHGVPQRVELQSLLQSLPDAVFLFDTHARIIDANKPAERLLDMTRTEILGGEERILSNRIVPGEADAAKGGILARALRGEHVRHERRNFCTERTGELKELLVSSSPMCDLGGAPIGALVLLQDATELSSLQRRVASSERHFAVGQMTAGLAHDFNNVLNSISEAVYVLEMERDRSEHDRSMLHIIDTAVRRGSEIVNNVREYLRGNRQMRQHLDTGQVLVEAVQLAQPMLETRSSILVVRDIQKTPLVEAVPAELRRVFTNLVLNAMEAMPQGGTLTLRCAISAGWVVASISDTGSGIAPAAQKMIFSPYFTTKPKGTGLGLAGARRAINSLGGKIHFESAPGLGTTFHVALPPAENALNRVRSSQIA